MRNKYSILCSFLSKIFKLLPLMHIALNKLLYTMSKIYDSKNKDIN